MLHPTDIVGMVAGLTGALLCLILLSAYWYFMWKRRKTKSPDYNAVGNFKPGGIFSWDSTTSITKSLHEEQHSVQPKYGLKSTYGHFYGDDISVHSSQTGSSQSSLMGSSVQTGSSLASSFKDTGSIHSGVKDTGILKETGSLHSGHSRESVRSKYSRCRTLSEMSESSTTSQDSVSFDTSTIGIKPELYTRKDAVLRQESSIATLGRLHIRLKYDFRTSDLIVHLIEAQDLNDFRESAGFSDPYVKLTLTPEIDNKVRQSSIQRHTKNPLFNEYFKFAVGFEELQDKQLSFTVYDFDRFSHNEIVGEVKIDFSTTDVSTTVEVWCDIEPSTGVDEGNGELLVSLSYLPTAERLTVVIMKARNLKQPRSSSKIDPVVRVNMLLDKKVVKRKKTTVHKSATNPVWNEALVFNVPPYLVVSMSLELTVTAHDLLGAGGCIGSCHIGKERQGNEGMHWHEMKNNVRKAIAKWQTLR